MIRLTDAQVRQMDARLTRMESSARDDTRMINQIRQIRLTLSKARKRARREVEHRKDIKTETKKL